MDFEQYIAARRIHLLRAAVLLGVDEARAPALVDEVLLDRAGAIRRSPDPDPPVYAALVAALPDLPAPPPDGHLPGYAVRRGLAALEPSARRVAVLTGHADLTPAATADAVGLTAARVLAEEIGAWRALGAPDRIRAQTLLALAADSVDIPPLPAMQAPRRRAAAGIAATVALVAAAVVAGLVFARDEPAPPDGILDPDQVPLLYGYDAGVAAALLEERGLDVDSRTAYACDPAGIVLATEPPTGTRLDDGDAITVVTAFPAGDACQRSFGERDDAWEVLRFAAGRDEAPEFARTETVVVDGGDPRTLSADAARDLGGMG